MDLSNLQTNSLGNTTINASHVRRRAVGSFHETHLFIKPRQTLVLFLALTILAGLSQSVTCEQRSSVESATEFSKSSPLLQIRETSLPLSDQQPSQSFTPSSVVDQKQQPTSDTQWRPPIGNERENEFFMSSPPSEHPEKDQQQSTTTSASEFITAPLEEQNEESTTFRNQPQAETTTVACPTEPEQNDNNEGLIAINATRKQFLTHDQLLTKDEPTINSSNDSSTYQRISQSSRAGMSRLASSFGLSDFFSRYARPKTPPAGPSQPDSTVEEQRAGANQQQSQSSSGCPGVCLDILTASLRCRNAIAAPCPSFFQKCCELDDVSFNGTPVETSAPITGGDSDNNPMSSTANAAQTGEQVSGDQQSVVSTTMRPPTTAAPSATTSTTAAAPTTSSSATPITRQQSDGVGFDQQRQPQLQSSVYFFSSAGDDSNNQGAERQNPHLEQRPQVWPASAANSSTATKSAGPSQGAGLAQSTGQQHDPTSTGNQKALSASQSFDLPLTTSNSDSIKSTSSPVTNRVVVLQTANGTAYLIPNQQSRPRPLYANWTDYQLLMTQMRPQQTTGSSSPVVYHSNIDPVRKLSGENSTSSASQKQPFDLTQKQPVESADNNKSINDNESSKVLKDQHSSMNNSNTKPKINSISTQHPQQQQQSTSSTTTTSTTTPQPQAPIITTTARTENRVEPSAASSTSNQQQQQTDVIDTTTNAVDTNAQDAQQSPVNGIANVLTSLFDAFMTSSSSSSASDTVDEARVPPNYNSADNLQPPGDLMTSSSFNVQNDQQNDRRLGLDLSFRQQNEQLDKNNGSASSGYHPSADEMMTSDGASETPSSNGNVDDTGDKCNGYCALDKFVGLCDSWHPSSVCGSSKKCCLTGRAGFATGASDNVGDDQQAAAANSNDRQHQRGPPQVCQGTCLPVYQSSLCTKPNELQLDSPSCLANQVCCYQPTEDIISNDDSHGSNASPDTQQPSLLSLASELFSSGSNNKQSSIGGDGSFSASLVPPPPPTLAVSNQNLDNENNLASSSLPRTAATQQQLMRHPTTVAYQQPTPRPTPTVGAKVVQSPNSSQANSGGLMNQILQMFRSNTGLGKQQRPKQQPQPQIIPQTFIQQPQPVYEIPAQSFPMLASGSAPRSQSMMPTQIVFPMIQHQQQPLVNSATGLGGGQLLMVPNQMQTASSNQQPQQVVIQSYGGLNVPQTANGVDASLLQQQLQRNNRFNHPSGGMLVNHNVQPQQQPQVAAQYPLTVDTDAMQMIQRQQQQFNSANRNPSQVNQFTQDQQLSFANNVPNYHLIQQQQLAQAQQPTQKLNPINRQQYQPITDAAGPLPTQHSTGTNNFLFAANNNRVQNNNPMTQTQAQNGAPRWTPQQQQLEPASTNAQRQNQPQFSNKNNNNFAASNAFNVPNASPSDPQVTRLTHQAKPNLAQNYQSAASPLVSSNSNTNRQQWVATQNSNGNYDPNSKQQHRIVSNINNDFIRPTIQNQQWSQLPPESDTNVVSLAAPSSDLIQSQLSATRATPATPSSQRPKQSTSNNPVQISTSASSNQLPQRVSAALATTTTAQPFTSKQMYGTQIKQTSSGMASAASNVNVMISRDDDSLALHRPTSSFPATSLDQNTSLQVIATKQPPLIISNDEEATIADDSDDQDAATNRRAPCQSICVPVSDCVQPNHINESSACSSSLEVCCVTGEAPSSRRQQGAVASNQHRLVSLPSTSVDNNKLDNQHVASDDNNNDVEQSSNSGNESHVFVDSSTVAVDTLDGDQQSASNDRPITNANKGQATACGLPGPARRHGRISSGRARGRVMGGFDSKPGYWCWQAALMNDRNEYLCGGALIGSKWVLTAAHCVAAPLRNETKLYVRLGQTDLNSSNTMERRAARSVLVKTSYVHHNHNGITLDNDIALLRLEDSVDLEEPTICTICLPERAGGNSPNQLEPGKRCTVTGYGFAHESGPAALRVRQTDLPIVSDSECQNKTSLVLAKPFSLPASSFCAGGEEGQDACHGDGGSPLACLVDGFYELTGIVSWGYKCGNKDLPGLYAKVTNFVGWINQIVSVNN